MERWVVVAVAVLLLPFATCVGAFAVDAALRGDPLDNLEARPGSLVFHLYARGALRRVPIVAPIAGVEPVFVDVPQDGTQSAMQDITYLSSAPRERILQATRDALGARFSEVEVFIEAKDAGNLVQVAAPP